MRKFVAISLLLLGLFAFEQLNVAEIATDNSCAVVENSYEPLYCNHNRTVDAEQPISVVVPSARTISVNGPRTHTYRAPHIATTGHYYTISNYVVAQFAHRLGSLPRAVDFYLYTLCRLRL